jgi:ABC-type antimicrobial peptide transport system permease subunit
MSLWKIVIRSLFHFWRNNLALALGAAIATAVLTGALLIGDSMRMSLTGLTLDRLGKIDELLVSDGFFREALADELVAQFQTDGQEVTASGLILFPGGTVETQPTIATGYATVSRASNVNVLGINESFWGFDANEFRPETTVADDAVIINQTLARELEIDASQWDDIGSAKIALTLRIPKPVQLPSESALGVSNDLIESIVDLKISQIIPDAGLGRFSLQPSQVAGPNLYLSIARLQERLRRKSLKHKSSPQQCNAILFSNLQSAAESKTGDGAADVMQLIRPELEDLGISLKRVTQKFGDQTQSVFDYWSLSSDRLVINDSLADSVQASFATAKPVLTYLANDIRKRGQPSGVPFSMVSAIELGVAFPLTANGKRIDCLSSDEIVLNRWAADDIEAAVGDEIEVTYFDPETTHGNQIEETALFTLAAIADLTAPETPFELTRRGGVVPATFSQRPTVANDPELTPAVPGVTDAESIENWDLPFQTADKLRAQDDDYWNDYRTTPKAFVSPERGRQMWQSRFGSVTSFRIPTSIGDSDSLSQTLLDQCAADQAEIGLRLIPIRKNGLKASSGSTPFDGLFLALSMFVITSALILVTLLFRLTMQNRASEIGVLQAVGLPMKDVSGVWLREMTLVCMGGAVLGVLMGIGYAGLMVYGLRTWWVGAISTPFIQLFITPKSLLIGLFSGLLVCVLTVWWSLRSANKMPVRRLLEGEFEVGDGNFVKRKSSLLSKLAPWLIGVLVVIATVLAFVATGLSGEPQAGAFMGAGFLVLVASLWVVYRWLKNENTGMAVDAGQSFDLGRFARLSARRSPLRSALTVGLIAVASFLIVAVSSFRLSPTELGTGGFDFVATSSQPIIADLNTDEGRSELLGDAEIPDAVKTYSLRLKPGQDASCNNLYQSTQPQVFGLPDSFIERFDQRDQRFEWAGSLTDNDNPWRSLLAENRKPSTENRSPIPVIIDKNTANYSLKIFALGTVYDVEFDSGEKVSFEVVGFLSNTVLQGSLIIAESDFKRVFPTVAGYRYFLVDGDQETMAVMESGLGDYGFDARPAAMVLENFMSVQNTYLNTFQALGGLGLLLGTFGMAVLQVRNVIERTGELGVMRAIGFNSTRISGLIFWETAWLMLVGLGVGVFSALFATLPHYFFGGASVPWLALVLIFSIVILCGLLASTIAAGVVQRRPLLSALRE